MLNVFITVDTELWPESWSHLSSRDLRIMLDRYIYGKTPKGEYGLPFQLRLLQEHGLSASFFVESLFAEGFGPAPLAEITDILGAAGQDVQLHVHSEWVDKFAVPVLPDPVHHNIADYAEADQIVLIGKALGHLRRCGVENIHAFRAGNFGAGYATLSALRHHGIGFDTSYNYPYLDSVCQLQTPQPLLQPVMLEDVCELPITFFEERHQCFRHVQLASCSYQEMQHLLNQAAMQNWSSFVIVSHGFELLNQAKNRPNPFIVKRFENLCRFLADNRDRFRTRTFAGLEAAELLGKDNALPLQSSLIRTAWRYGEQAVSRLF
jgi:hypothetical protein